MEGRRFGPVRFIPGKNDGKYPACHSLFIEGDGVLIDPASDRERLMRLREASEVKAVWLSHWHEDHLMHLDLFDDLPLCISKMDSTPISDLGLFLDAYGMEDRDEREYWKDILKNNFNFRPRKPSRFLKGGETIAVAGILQLQEGMKVRLWEQQ